MQTIEKNKFFIKSLSVPFFYFMVAVTFLFSTSSWAQTFEVPKLTGPVVDQTELLTPNQANQLAQFIRQVRAQNGPQFQVVILSSLQGTSVEDAAIKIFDQWKLGDQKRDDGLLILVAPKERRMRIEVGQGLEGAIPDVVAGRIIRQVMRPHFQNGDYYQGIGRALEVLSQQQMKDLQDAVNTSSEPTGNVQKKSEKASGSNSLVYLIIAGCWLLIFFFNPSLALNLLFLAMSGGRGGGGRGGGGGWSGGGGSSSGGGASGDW